jgi:hypothetical protein
VSSWHKTHGESLNIVFFPYHKIQSVEFLAKETTLPNSLTKRTTCESNCQKGPPPAWRQRPLVTRGACRQRGWRQHPADARGGGTVARMAAVHAPFRAVGPAAMVAGGKCAWRMPPHVVAAGLCLAPCADASEQSLGVTCVGRRWSLRLSSS